MVRDLKLKEKDLLETLTEVKFIVEIKLITIKKQSKLAEFL